jgi:hypothetical protein
VGKLFGGSEQGSGLLQPGQTARAVRVQLSGRSHSSSDGDHSHLLRHIQVVSGVQVGQESRIICYDTSVNEDEACNDLGWEVNRSCGRALSSIREGLVVVLGVVESVEFSEENRGVRLIFKRSNEDLIAH